MKSSSLALLLTAAATVAVAAPPTLTNARTTAVSAGSYTPVTSRGVFAGQIVRKWADYVNKVYGTSPGTWANAMAATFATADLHNMAGALKRTTFEGMMSALSGQHTSDAKIIDQMAKSSGSLAVIQALGSPSADLVYTAVTPCRLFDTRVAGGPIAANSTRNFISSGPNFTAQGGAATDCNIPADVPAIVVNVTTVLPPGTGYVTVFPYNQPRPMAAGVNFIPNTSNGNELIVKQTMGQAFDFSIYAFSQTQVTGDVAGYFDAPLATALECVDVVGTPISIPVLSTLTANVAACAAGFTSTALRCEQTGILNVNALIASVTANGCVFTNQSGVLTATATAVRTCCRVPGR